jgi:hypothetical protein
VPRISDRIVRAIVYIYSTEEAARANQRDGGTGFLVTLPMAESEEGGHLLVVTAGHVVGHGRDMWLRVNRQVGPADVIPVPRDKWFHHPDGDDVAVALITDDWLEVGREFMAIPPDWFVSTGVLADLDIGRGDDAFFVGRFVDGDQGDTNMPTARFGSIANMLIPVKDPKRGLTQESFVVEARSLSGFSGSPVFIHLQPMTPRPSEALDPVRKVVLERNGAGPYLLGIDWAHLGWSEPVRDKRGQPLAHGEHVATNSGMLAVLPAWKIAEVIALPLLQAAIENDRLEFERLNRGAVDP